MNKNKIIYKNKNNNKKSDEPIMNSSLIKYLNTKDYKSCAISSILNISNISPFLISLKFSIEAPHS